jgi:hypothetical protein
MFESPSLSKEPNYDYVRANLLAESSEPNSGSFLEMFGSPSLNKEPNYDYVRANPLAKSTELIPGFVLRDVRKVVV